MKIGCHVSVAKGFAQAAKNARALGADAFQIFTKNPRGLRSKKIDPRDAEEGVAYCREHGMVLVAHTPYVTNLSTPDDELWQVTVRSIAEDLRIAEAYGAVGAVVHCGKHVGRGEAFGLRRMVEAIDAIFELYNGPTKLLLENTAGQGSELGQTFETLLEVRAATRHPERVGFCFDTCHAFAAGLWNGDTVDELVRAMEETGYLDHVAVLHVNDSKAPFGSRKDRHEKIGRGEIGADALKRLLLADPLAHLPVVLETPVEDEREYAEEIALLRAWLAEKE